MIEILSMKMFVLLAAIFATVSAEFQERGPANKSDFSSGYWFGTQTMHCLSGKPSQGGGISRRSLAPSRTGYRYIHSLLFYRHHVFEWGSGARGYHIGHSASVTDCPITWELLPAGTSWCPVDAVRSFAKQYRRKYGGYNLLVNNCHQFVNRVSRLLSSSNCDVVPEGDVVGGDEAPVQEQFVVRAWEVINRILSYVTGTPTTSRPITFSDNEDDVQMVE